MAAAPTPEFVAYCLELLASAGPVRARRMFGGHGVYLDDLFVAIVVDDCLYLKADAQTRPLFETAGCLPFTYEAAGKRTSISYFSAPDEAMESPPLMRPWARHALSAALRARAAKPRAATPVRKARPRKGSARTAPTKL